MGALIILPLPRWSPTWRMREGSAVVDEVAGQEGLAGGYPGSGVVLGVGGAGEGDACGVARGGIGLGNGNR